MLLLYPSKEEAKRIKGRERAAIFRKEHPEKHRENVKKWQKAHPEKRRKMYNEWRAKNKDHINDYNKKYKNSLSPEKKEKYKITMSNWVKNNMDKVRKNISIYEKKYPDKKRLRLNKWRKNNRDKVNASTRKYYKKYPDKVKVRNEKFRNTPKGKVYNRKRQSIRRRELGYECLNEYVEGFEGHHINAQQVVFIPAELHKKYRHDHEKPETMEVINRIAMQYLFNCKA